MTHNPKPRNQTWVIVLFVIVAVAILLLRMVVFVAGHGRHRF
jgi:uncharacterized membrane protein affecting hemolysin expression